MVEVPEAEQVLREVNEEQQEGEAVLNKVQEQLVGLESTWVHLEWKQGAPIHDGDAQFNQQGLSVEVVDSLPQPTGVGCVL